MEILTCCWASDVSFAESFTTIGELKGIQNENLKVIIFDLFVSSKSFKISSSDMKINVYLGIIGMIVDPGLVTDGSANDAIPPTRGF